MTDPSNRSAVPSKGVESPRHRWIRGKPWASDNYGMVLIAVLVTLVVMAVLGDLGAGRVLGVVLLGGVFVLTLGASSVGRRPTGIAALAVLVAVAAAIGAAAAGATTAGRAVVVFISAVFVIASPLVIVRRLARHPEVSAGTVLGALCLYLFLGLFFALVYVGYGLADHGRFFAQMAVGKSMDYVYFSLATLTTVGFGDLSPVSDLGRMTAVIEAITGQFYLVTVIALLVSNFASGRSGSRRPADRD